jgi:protocatechuate 3,4-dioxygenase beta subunit
MQIVAGANYLNVSMTTTVVNSYLTGLVKDSSGSPISGASVYVDGGSGVPTDTNGSYYIEGLTPGTHTVVFAKSGYNTETR